MALALASCAAPGPLPEAPRAPSAPGAALVVPDSSTPAPTHTPRPPTATAVEFQLRPSSTFAASPTPVTPVTPEPSATPNGAGPAGFPPGINPLTGLPVADPALLERRPMAIKVTNYPRGVRPQWGLSLADHVYEYYLENMLARFIGVFYGNDASRVGPVRSARLFDEHVMRMYKAIFAFGYADDAVILPWVESDLRNYLVVERSDNCPPLCRIGSKEKDYNTLFADTHELSAYITRRGTDNSRQNLDGLRFEDAVPTGGVPASPVYIRYSLVAYNYWKYDPLTRSFVRYQDTKDDRSGTGYELLIDNLTDQALRADNLVVLMVPHTYFRKTSSTEIFDIQLFGTGKGYVLRDGRLYPITWRRYASDALVGLVLPDGQAFPLKPGNVWFEILSETSSLEHGGDTVWQFNFQVPEYLAPAP